MAVAEPTTGERQEAHPTPRQRMPTTSSATETPEATDGEQVEPQPVSLVAVVVVLERPAHMLVTLILASVVPGA